MHTILKSLFILCASSACQLAHADSEQRNVAGFTEVAVASGINLDIRQGASFAVEVETDNGDTDDIVTEVVDGTLRIYIDRSWFFTGIFDWFDTFDANVTLPELAALRVSGGSDVVGTGTFTGSSLALRSSGGSDIELDLAMDTLDITLSGGSDINLSGSANQVTAQISGGSDLEATRLSVKEADLRASGGSDIDMTVTDSLTAKASGGSDITYTGDPQIRDIDSSGGSDISQGRR